MKKEWTKTSELLPEHQGEVWIAGEMKYDSDDETDYFVGIGWLADKQMYELQRKIHPAAPEDVNRWNTLNDWWEGQPHYKITHWMEMEEPEHPNENVK